MLDLDKIDFKKVDVDVDEDGHMWLVEENDWKSAAEEKELYNSVPPADTMTPVKEALTVLFLFGVFYIWLVIGSVS